MVNNLTTIEFFYKVPMAYHWYMFSDFTKYTLNKGFDCQIVIQVNTQTNHRFDWRFGSLWHFHTFVPTAQEVHMLSLSNMKAQFMFCHP